MTFTTRLRPRDDAPRKHQLSSTNHQGDSRRRLTENLHPKPIQRLDQVGEFGIHAPSNNYMMERVKVPFRHSPSTEPVSWNLISQWIGIPDPPVSRVSLPKT